MNGRAPLTALPDHAFDRMPRLRRLDLSENELTTVPESLLGLPNLKAVDLRFTRLDRTTRDRLREELPHVHVHL